MDLQPRDVLRMAWEAVEGAGVPADLRPIAFTTAVDLVVTGRVGAVSGGPGVPSVPVHRMRPGVAAGTSSIEVAPAPVTPSSRPEPGPGAADGVPPAWSGAAAPAPGVPPSRPAPTSVASTGAHGQFDMAAIAEHIGVRVERLDRLYDAHNGTLELCGDPGRFGRTRAERVGNVVLLLLAAMRWSQRDGGHAVPDVLVRAEVARLGLLDVGNYSKHLAARRSLWATTGSGRAASYRVRYDGLEEARRLARTLLEEPPL